VRGDACVGHGRGFAAQSQCALGRCATAGGVGARRGGAGAARRGACREQTRAARRFDRYDQDSNGSVAREEYLAPRRKAFVRLDANHDGALSFDEWAVKTEARFAEADKDKSGSMTPSEFAATAPKRKPPRIRRDCPAPEAAATTPGDDG
jgi:hypothetical protein